MTFAGGRDEVANPTEQYRGSEGFRPPGWAGPVGGAGRSLRPTATSAAPGPLGSVFTMSRFSRSVRSCTISQRSARIEMQRPSSRRGRRRRGAPACDPGHDGCAAPTGPTPILFRSTDRSRRPGRPATAPCPGVIAGAGLFDFDHVDARTGPTARSRTARTARGTAPEPGYRTGPRLRPFAIRRRGDRVLVDARSGQGRGCGGRHPGSAVPRPRSATGPAMLRHRRAPRRSRRTPASRTARLGVRFD